VQHLSQKEVMRFKVFATDYDGPLAHHGLVEASTNDARIELRASGRATLLVTTRASGGPCLPIRLLE
jgi:hydroxymethylpyrimidine pyrophosphatase-like HAD family hydrolase